MWIRIVEAAKLSGLSVSGVKYHVAQCQAYPELFNMRKHKYGVWEIEQASFLAYLETVRSKGKEK